MNLEIGIKQHQREKGDSFNEIFRGASPKSRLTNRRELGYNNVTVKVFRSGMFRNGGKYDQ